jgi:hypothetical protein
MSRSICTLTVAARTLAPRARPRACRPSSGQNAVARQPLGGLFLPPPSRPGRSPLLRPDGRAAAPSSTRPAGPLPPPPPGRPGSCPGRRRGCGGRRGGVACCSGTNLRRDRAWGRSGSGTIREGRAVLAGEREGAEGARQSSVRRVQLREPRVAEKTGLDWKGTNRRRWSGGRSSRWSHRSGSRRGRLPRRTRSEVRTAGVCGRAEHARST